MGLWEIEKGSSVINLDLTKEDAGQSVCNDKTL